jgi:hypothetical protein
VIHSQIFSQLPFQFLEQLPVVRNPGIVPGPFQNTGILLKIGQESLGDIDHWFEEQICGTIIWIPPGLFSREHKVRFF